MGLPWWYCGNIVYLNNNIRNARKENPPGPFCLEHARLLSGCYSDRKYIDTVLEHAGFEIKTGQEKKWIQAYSDIGLTLCDLGYCSEGIPYLEKAIDLEKRPEFRSHLTLLLCCRLNDKASCKKRLDLAQTLANDRPTDTNVKALFAKACIDARRFDDAEKAVREIVKKYPKAYGFLLAELRFSSRDFKAASDAFDRYKIGRGLRFWWAEYDYKKALAYYYSDQQDKSRRQAMRIRRRMKWDRFYKLHDIENAGIERVPAIDEIIESDEEDNVLFDVDKISHYFRAIHHITRLYILKYLHIILLLVP